MAPLRIATWNVNSIRARLDHVLTWLADHEPEVVCLQETKVEDKLFPRVPFLELGYTVSIHGSKGYAGVATLTKAKPSAIHCGFRDGPADAHCRILSTEVEGVAVYNLYVPNGTEVGSDAFTYKLGWLRRLRGELDAHHPKGSSLVVCGDFNIAPDDRDASDPEAMRGRLHFTDEERAALEELKAWGLRDAFRMRVEDGGHYTWFDYRTNGFARGEGLRIDHVYVSDAMAERCTEVKTDLEPRGWDVPSDHAPVVATFGSD